MGQPVDIFRLSGRKYPIYILPITFSAASFVIVPPEGLTRLPCANKALGFWQREASTDRGSFGAITAWPDMTNSEDYAGSI